MEKVNSNNGVENALPFINTIPFFDASTSFIVYRDILVAKGRT